MGYYDDIEAVRCARLDRFEATELDGYIELLDMAGNLEAHLICETIFNLPRTNLIFELISESKSGAHYKQQTGFAGKTFIETAEFLSRFDCTNYLRWCDNNRERMNFDGTAIRTRAQQLFNTYMIYHFKKETKK